MEKLKQEGRAQNAKHNNVSMNKSKSNTLGQTHHFTPNTTEVNV